MLMHHYFHCYHFYHYLAIMFHDSILILFIHSHLYLPHSPIPTTHSCHHLLPPPPATHHHHLIIIIHFVLNFNLPPLHLLIIMLLVYPFIILIPINFFLFFLHLFIIIIR